MEVVESPTAKFAVYPILSPPSRERAFCQPGDNITQDEVRVLGQLRKLREQVVSIKSRLHTATTNRSELLAELQRVRIEARVWRQMRDVAYRNKHIMLGHLEPEEEETVAESGVTASS